MAAGLAHDAERVSGQTFFGAELLDRFARFLDSTRPVDGVAVCAAVHYGERGDKRVLGHKVHQSSDPALDQQRVVADSHGDGAAHGACPDRGKEHSTREK